VNVITYGVREKKNIYLHVALENVNQVEISFEGCVVFEFGWEVEAQVKRQDKTQWRCSLQFP